MQFLRSGKSNHFFLSILILMITSLFLAGCVESDNNQSDSSLAADGGFSTPIPLPRGKIPPESTLTAFLVIDGGTPIPMKVNGDNVSANTEELSAGDHRFTINYFLNGKRIASAISNATIIAG